MDREENGMAGSSRAAARPAGRRGPRPATAPSPRVRTAVLGAAHDLIEADGFFGLTVDGLVGASGISKATIYRWWENRAAVALDVLTEFVPVSAEDASDPAAGSVAVDELTRLVRAEVAYLRTGAGSVIAGLVADAQRDAGRARTFEERYLAPRRRRLEEAAGQVAGADAAAQLAETIQSAVYGRLLLRPEGLDAAWADRLLALLAHP
jgi:AcrR family transcriptional regulator